jgi:hypothetical protein
MLRPGPGTCFVAGGSCSERPCIVFVHGGGDSIPMAPARPVGLRLARSVRPLQLGRQTCPPGSLLPSQTMRVSAMTQPLIAVPRPLARP